MNRVRWQLLAALCTLVVGTGVSFEASASTTDGTIDATDKYAWGENLGWLNLGTSGGNVHVTDSALTGYIWSEHYGWINLAPAGSGVTNNNEGTLAGQAWGENLGYIDFNGVTINSSGVFAGTASGTVAGRISFDCSNCTVTTDWRPASSRSSSGSSGGGGTGGGGGAAPITLGIAINGGAASTISPSVTLAIASDSSVTHVYISNFADFHDAVREPILPSRQWNLCTEGGVMQSFCPQGIYTVYAKFYSSAGGNSYGPFSSRIYYGTPPAGYIPPSSLGSGQPAQGTGSATTPSFLGNISDFLGGLVPDFLKSGSTPQPVSSEPVVPVEAPPALKGAWTLLPERAINEFAFAPLPKNLDILAAKFPAIKETFNNLGIAYQSDIQKLRGVTLRIPGFSESVLSAAGLDTAKLAEIPGIRLVDLSPGVTRALPTEAMFVRAENEAIDVPVVVRVDDQGAVEEHFKTISGTILKLVVKPEGKAKQVLGYLAFTSRGGGGYGVGLQTGSLFAAAGSTIGSSFGVGLAPDEERFVLREFIYSDKDNDGIYTATIQTPIVEGTYQIHTLIDYEDPQVANKNLKLTAVVDPEGYVYERIGNKELRIPGATVTMLWLNPQTNQYDQWSAARFNQENPQVTDVRGTYGFLVPPGRYLITAQAPGYSAYEGKPFDVTEHGSGVHINIELSSGRSWLSTIDWKTDLLILMALFLAYNFYVARRRSWAHS